MTDRDIKALYDLKAAALARHPEMGAAGGEALAALADGELRCRVQLDDRALEVDLPPDDGGRGAAPHPGQLLRASIAAGLAFGYRVWAARLGVALGRVEVAVRCDYDTRGPLGVGPAFTARWERVTVDVVVSGPVALADARRVVAAADQHAPALANLSREIERVHRLTVENQTQHERIEP